MINYSTKARAHVSQRNKKGFTLTEIAIVLGIIGLILGAIWTAAASVYTNQRNSHANTAVLQIAQGVRTMFATSSTVGTAADITSAVINAGAAPSDLVNGATLNGPWAGSTIKVITKAATDAGFTIEVNKIPANGCISLITTVDGNNHDSGLFSVEATGAAAGATAPILNAAAGAGTALTVGTPPSINATVAQANSACSGAGNTNIVQFGFSIQ